MNPLDLLSGISYLADTPGAYTRGLLSGRPGERVSGDEMLKAWDLNPEGLGGAGGFAAEVATDPLTWLTMGGAAALSPIAKGVGRGFVGAAKQMVNPRNATAWSIPMPLAKELSSVADNPLGRLAAQAKIIEPLSPGTRFSIDPLTQKQLYRYPAPRNPDKDTYAIHQLASKRIIPNLNVDEWATDEGMRGISKYLVERNYAPAGLGGMSDYVGTHELVHALRRPRWEQLNHLAKTGEVESALNPGMELLHMNNQLRGLSYGDKARIKNYLGKYALQDIEEYIAEAGASVLGRQQPLPRPLQNLYEAFQGPSLENLPPEFWKGIVR